MNESALRFISTKEAGGSQSNFTQKLHLVLAINLFYRPGGCGKVKRQPLFLTKLDL